MATDEQTANTASTDPTQVGSTSTASSASSKVSSSPRTWIPPTSALHFIAGGLGGMAGAIVTAPFDLAKTRLQSDLYSRPRPTTLARQAGALRKAWWHFADTGTFMREIAKKEGFRALYSGLGPTLAGAVPSRAVNFWAYGNGKSFYATRLHSTPDSPLVQLISAASAGVITAVSMNPVWVVKTRLQLEENNLSPRPSSTSSSSSPSTSSSTSRISKSTRSIHTFSPSYSIWTEAFQRSSKPTAFGCLMKIVREEGVPGLYRGLSASLLGVTEGTIQWVLYEQFKSLGRPSTPSSSNSRSDESWSTRILSAGSAKLLATLVTYPHEVVRTRMRQPVKEGEVRRYTGLAQTFGEVWKTEGVGALYGGLTPHLMRVVPNAVVMFAVYEGVVRMGNRREEQEEEDRR